MGSPHTPNAFVRGLVNTYPVRTSLHSTMADIDPNFTCFNRELSHSNITDEVWMIKSEGSLHENSVLAVAIFQLVFMLLSVPWNFAILASIILMKLYKDASYLLLMNLVAADFLVCVLVLPFNIASGFAREFSIGSSDHSRCQACHSVVVLMLLLILVSLFTMSLMAVDRLNLFEETFEIL